VPEPCAEPALRDLTVGGLLDEHRKMAHQEAIVFSSYDDLGVAARWTYAELGERARRSARADRVRDRAGGALRIWATNLPEWLEASVRAPTRGS